MFAAKTNRTKMEEEPVQCVPDTEEKVDFINASKAEETQPVERFNDTVEVKVETAAVDDEFDLSDIKTTVGEPSREDIIAAAEAAAFNEG